MFYSVGDTPPHTARAPLARRKEARVDAAAGAAFAADGATAAAGSFNAAWLGAHAARESRRERAFAAATLALLNAGIAVQAIFAASSTRSRTRESMRIPASAAFASPAKRPCSSHSYHRSVAARAPLPSPTSTKGA